MKIAFVHPAMRDYRLDIFEKLNDNYDIKFFFTIQGTGQENIKEDHISTPPHWASKTLTTKFRAKNKDLGMLFRLIKEIYFGDFDLLVCSTNRRICWTIAKIKRKKIIMWTEFWLWNNNSFFQRLANRSTFYVFINSDAIIATGSKAFQSQRLLGVDESKIFVYPQCSKDYTSIVPEKMELDAELKDKKIILYCGRLTKVKGLNILIEAIHKLNLMMEDTHLVILGRGPLEDECRQMAVNLDVKNISFMGHVEVPIKAFFYKKCNVFVAPSLFYNGGYEPWGLVVNEAMAFGKPVIGTTAVGSAFDLIVNGKNGFMVEEGNPDELCEALYNILSNDKIEDKMGLTSLKLYAEKNDYLKFYNSFKSAIDFVCNL
jgi:glycosyltransferase involved in cell wall biosynthesis